ncbi:hypothetical protein BGX34_006546 [Mortierella sp. NVP85]|nr:hypothetical protein BGX34_006546 [Mortierella sp. NVP85]
MDLQEVHPGAESWSHPSSRKKCRVCFTPEHETFIAEQLMDPEKFVALDGPGDRYTGQRLKMLFYANLAEAYNKKFGTSLIPVDIQGKIHQMKWSWITTYRIKCSSHHNSWTPSQWEDWIKGRCHFYSILTPALLHVVSNADDDLINGEQDDHDHDGDGEGGDTHGHPSGSRVIGGFLTDKDKNKAASSQTPSNEMDLLTMLKDLKDTSKIQREAEMEQTRREQMQFAERARAQQEDIRLEELRVQEATLRVEEARVREEEITKREAIQAEVEKSKNQIRMKELEIQHTNRVLLLEEARLRRAVLEMEKLKMSKMKENTLATE